MAAADEAPRLHAGCNRRSHAVGGVFDGNGARWDKAHLACRIKKHVWFGLARFDLFGRHHSVKKMLDVEHIKHSVNIAARR